MSIESSIEARIREAIERGDFDNLAGKGKPLNLDDYFNTPEDLRMAFAMLKSNEFVPEEVEIMREIAAIREQLNDTRDTSDKEALAKKLHDKSLALALMRENRKRKR